MTDCLESAFIGATRGHPILKKAIDLILWNIEHEHYGVDCIYPTGPGLFFQAAIDHIRKFPRECCIGRVIQVRFLGKHTVGLRLTNSRRCPWKGKRSTLSLVAKSGSEESTTTLLVRSTRTSRYSVSRFACEVLPRY